jgi:hypothetical protein
VVGGYGACVPGVALLYWLHAGFTGRDVLQTAQLVGAAGSEHRE